VSASLPPSDGLRWTLGTYVLLGSGVSLLLFAVATRAATPIFVALPLVVAPLVAALSAPRGVFRARLDWHAGGAEGEVTVEGALRATARADLADAVLTFGCPSDLSERSPPEIRPSRESIEFTLHWVAPYPTVSVVDPPDVVWRDPVGLVERSARTDGPPLRVERYPSELIRLGVVRLDRVLALPGESHSRRIGTAGEFFGIRDAAPTDPPRRINWHASARTGRLLTNEFELDRTGDVLLLLDTRPTRLGPAFDEILLGAGRAAAIGLVDAFAREKARVGFAAFGEFVQPVPLASGRGHRLRVREAIRSTRGASISGPSERCAATLPRFYAPGVTTVLISSLTGDADPDLVVYLRRRGYPTVVLSPSPARIRSPHSPLPAEDEAIAERLERLSRRQGLARVWVHAPVVDWEEFWSLGGFVRLLRGGVRRRHT